MSKDFHVLLQNGTLYKNVKVLTNNGYASSNADMYWTLMSENKITIEIQRNNNIEFKELLKEDIYHFCISSKYSTLQ